MRADGKSINQPQPERQRQPRCRSPNGRCKVCYVYVIFHIYIYSQYIYFIDEMLRVRSRCSTLCFPFSFHPFAPSRTAYNYEHEDGPTSRAWRLHAKPLKDKWAISEKLLLFYVENFSPIYVGGCECICVCVCVRVTVIIVLCQVLLPSTSHIRSRIRSRIASHNVPYIMACWPYNAPSYMHGMPLCLSLSLSLSLSGVSASPWSFATFKCIARCP